MVEKKYRIRITVPLGSREGTMLLREAKGRVEGWMSVMNKKNLFSGVLSCDGQLTLNGVIQTLVRTLNYTARGEIIGQNIFLNLQTNTGAHYSLAGEEYPVDD